MTATAAAVTAAIPPKPKLGYAYEFEPRELDAIKKCHDEHGFAIVKGVLEKAYVDELRASVDATLNPNNDLRSDETRFHTWFVEVSAPLLRLLENERHMAVQRKLLGDPKEMSVHRSAGLLKSVGAPVGAWHTDQAFKPDPPTDTGDVLNRGEWPNGMWYYLEGTHPSRGGLAIIEDSHRPDWKGPEGFEFTAKKKSFHRVGEPANKMCDTMDVPGVVPLYTDPGDMIVFAARTYHGVFPHNGSEPRRSCGFVCRAGDEPFPTPWQHFESTRKFLDSVPAHLKRYFRGYPGIDRAWKAQY